MKGLGRFGFRGLRAFEDKKILPPDCSGGSVQACWSLALSASIIASLMAACSASAS